MEALTRRSIVFLLGAILFSLPPAGSLASTTFTPCIIDIDCPVQQCCVKIHQNPKWDWLLKRLPPALCMDRLKAREHCGGLGPGYCRTQRDCAPLECCRQERLNGSQEEFSLSIGKCVSLGQDGAKCIMEIPSGVTGPVPACPCAHDVNCFPDGRVLPTYGHSGTCMMSDVRFCFGQNECGRNECCRMMRASPPPALQRRRKRQALSGDPTYYGDPHYQPIGTRRYVLSRPGSGVGPGGQQDPNLPRTAATPISEAVIEQTQTFHEMLPPGSDQRTWGVCVKIGSTGSQCLAQPFRRPPAGFQYLCPCTRGLDCVRDGGTLGNLGYTGTCNRTRVIQCRTERDCAPNECCRSLQRPGEVTTIHIGGVCTSLGVHGDECMASSFVSLLGGSNSNNKGGIKLYCPCQRDQYCVADQGGHKDLYGIKGRCRKTEHGVCHSGADCFSDECCMSTLTNFLVAGKRKKRQADFMGVCTKMGTSGASCPLGYPSRKPALVVLQCPCNANLTCQAPGADTTRPVQYMGIPQGLCQ